MSRKRTVQPAEEESIWNFRGVKKRTATKPVSKSKSKSIKSAKKSKDRFQQLLFHAEPPKIASTSSLKQEQPDEVSIQADNPIIIDDDDQPDIIPETPPASPKTEPCCSTVDVLEPKDTAGSSGSVKAEPSSPDDAGSQTSARVMSENEEEADDCSSSSEDEGESATGKNESELPSCSKTAAKSAMTMRQTDLSAFLGLPGTKQKLQRQTSMLSFFSGSRTKSERFVAEPVVSGKSKKPAWTRKAISDPSAVTGRKCPFYKWIQGTSFTVDAFRYGAIPGCSAYFLTHFHADHYGGLTRHFKQPIFCSRETGNLVIQRLRVDASRVRTLEWNEPTMVEQTRVTLVDANHCPGAAMILFELPSGQRHLHTGDFRASEELCRQAARWRGLIDDLYLDTTYCQPEYAFPSQHEAVEAVKRLVTKEMELNRRTLIVCGTYQIGKERIFLAIAETLQCSVFVRREKYRILKCLEDAKIDAVMTTDGNSTNVHVVPMTDLRTDRLRDYRVKQGGRYERVLALRPTGWTHSAKGQAAGPVRRVDGGKDCDIYGVSYSEHSSFTELRHFVRTVRPRRIIPTVNNGSTESRERMNKLFGEWLDKT